MIEHELNSGGLFTTKKQQDRLYPHALIRRRSYSTRRSQVDKENHQTQAAPQPEGDKSSLDQKPAAKIRNASAQPMKARPKWSKP